MAEIVGVVAAATQLSSTCMGIIDFMKKIKGGSFALREFQNQLEQVRSLSQAISLNPLLQTPEVEASTCSLLDAVNHNSIHSLVERRRILLPLIFIFKEREIAEVCLSLERQKSSLALLIHHLQAQALHRLESNLSEMASSPKLETRTSTFAKGASSLASDTSASSATAVERDFTNLRFKALPSLPMTPEEKMEYKPMQGTSEMPLDDASGPGSSNGWNPAQGLSPSQVLGLADSWRTIVKELRKDLPHYAIVAGNTATGGISQEFLGSGDSDSDSDDSSAEGSRNPEGVCVTGSAVYGGDQNFGGFRSGDICAANYAAAALVNGQYRAGKQTFGPFKTSKARKSKSG